MTSDQEQPDFQVASHAGRTRYTEPRTAAVSNIGITCSPSFLEQRKSGMIAAMPAGRKRLALHDGYLVLVLMNAIMMDTIVDDVVNSRSGAEVAWFELFHGLNCSMID
jgi:hypothetical protein